MSVGMLAPWFPENVEEGINSFACFLSHLKTALLRGATVLVPSEGLGEVKSFTIWNDV